MWTQIRCESKVGGTRFETTLPKVGDEPQGLSGDPEFLRHLASHYSTIEAERAAFMYMCPVCGYDRLTSKPEREDMPNFVPCPC